VNVTELIDLLNKKLQENDDADGTMEVLGLSESGLVYEIDDIAWDGDTKEIYLNIVEAEEEDDVDEEEDDDSSDEHEDEDEVRITQVELRVGTDL
jgi:hypothetical protein